MRVIISQKEPQLSEFEENKRIGVKLQTNDKVRVLSQNVNFNTYRKL